MQAKRIQVNEANVGANGKVEVILTTPTDPREEVNYHNIWIGATCEPQDAGANCQGTWVLYMNTNPGSGLSTFSDAAVNLETINQMILACGVFSASNESPWTLPPTTLKTSRNLPPGGRLILQLITTGITVGLSSNRVMLCAHTVRK